MAEKIPVIESQRDNLGRGSHKAILQEAADAIREVRLAWERKE